MQIKNLVDYSVSSAQSFANQTVNRGGRAISYMQANPLAVAVTLLAIGLLGVLVFGYTCFKALEKKVKDLTEDSKGTKELLEAMKEEMKKSSEQYAQDWNATQESLEAMKEETKKSSEQYAQDWNATQESLEAMKEEMKKSSKQSAQDWNAIQESLEAMKEEMKKSSEQYAQDWSETQESLEAMKEEMKNLEEDLVNQSENQSKSLDENQATFIENIQKIKNELIENIQRIKSDHITDVQQIKKDLENVFDDVDYVAELQEQLKESLQAELQEQLKESLQNALVMMDTLNVRIGGLENAVKDLNHDKAEKLIDDLSNTPTVLMQAEIKKANDALNVPLSPSKNIQSLGNVETHIATPFKTRRSATSSNTNHQGARIQTKKD